MVLTVVCVFYVLKNLGYLEPIFKKFGYVPENRLPKLEALRATSNIPQYPVPVESDVVDEEFAVRLAASEKAPVSTILYYLGRVPDT